MKKEFEKWWKRTYSKKKMADDKSSLWPMIEEIAFKAWKKATELERQNNPNYVKRCKSEDLPF